MLICCIGSVKSCWHIFEFPMHVQSPTVYRLSVHLEDQQLVFYNADDNVNDVMERGATKETPLTAWFKINNSNPLARKQLIRTFPSSGFTMTSLRFGNQDNKVKPSVTCTLHLHLLENAFIFVSFSQSFQVLLLLLIYTKSTTSNATLSKKPVLPLACLRTIMSGDSVSQKLAKCSWVTLFACSSLLSSYIVIQLHPLTSGTFLRNASLMIYASNLQIFIPTILFSG